MELKDDKKNYEIVKLKRNQKAIISSILCGSLILINSILSFTNQPPAGLITISTINLFIHIIYSIMHTIVATVLIRKWAQKKNLNNSYITSFSIAIIWSIIGFFQRIASPMLILRKWGFVAWFISFLITYLSYSYFSILLVMSFYKIKFKFEKVPIEIIVPIIEPVINFLFGLNYPLFSFFYYL